MKIVLKPLMAATAVSAMLAVDAVTAKDKEREENKSPFKAYIGKLPDNDKLNNSDEKKVPGVKPETIEMEIIKGLSADIKVSEGVEKIQEPALSTCFASPFYLAEIKIGELVWRQKVSFARTNKGMVMIPKPQASSGKLQAPSTKLQASSRKLQARGPRILNKVLRTSDRGA